MANNQTENKRRSPIKIIGILIGIFLVLSISTSLFSDSENETSTRSEDTQIINKEQADAESEDASLDLGTYDFYAAFQENGVIDYTLNAKASQFLQEHAELFPADSSETISEAGLTDESLEARQIMKSPDRYGDRLMFLPELQVIQIQEAEVDTERYLTLINTIDYAGQQYYILYDGVLDDIFDGDWICVYALPLGATTFENTEGGETWTIPMAGSYVEKINLDEPL